MVNWMVNPVRNSKDRWLGALAIVLALTIWECYAAMIMKDNFLLPGPVDVVSAFLELVQRGILLLDFQVSLVHFCVGLGLALLIGIPIGIAMGWSRKFDAFMDPIIELLRPIPPLAWIPFAIIWFGFTTVSAGFVILMGAVFPILINTYSGFRSVPRIFVEAGKMLGCTKNRDLIRYIAFPAALPSVVSGIRIATGVGWMCLVAAEMFGASNRGLGYQLWFNYYLHRMDFVLVYMLLLGFLGLFIDRIFRHYVDSKLLKWTAGTVV